ncbi:MAG: helix-turn-helix domain-containing protein [Alphaproteobacteria bacterium]
MQEQFIATSYAMILGQMIRQLREEKSLDQADLAKHLGVSVMTISRIECGDTVLDVPQMEKVASFFDMDATDFFDKSLKIKRTAERKNYTVFQNKKEINKNSNVALLSVAAIVGIVAGIMLSKK